MDRLVTANGINIDLSEGIPIPLSFSIADFKEPDKRQRNFSKEVTIPGTANNMKFLMSAFNLTHTLGAYNFDATARVNCTYYKQDIAVLPNAVLKLNKAIITDGKLEFKIGLFSDFVDIFLLLSNVNIRDLGWDGYNHVLNNANIINSWSTPVGSGYYYPLIERQARATPNRWSNTEMVPYLHFSEIFKKCMDYVGQKFTSNWLNSTAVKSILYGYGGGNWVDSALSATEINNRKVLTNNGSMNYSQVSTESTISSMPITTPRQFPQINMEGLLSLVEVQDNYNQLNGAVFTALRTGSMRLELSGTLRLRYVLSTSSGNPTYSGGGTRTLFYSKNGVFHPITTLTQNSFDNSFVINQAVDLDVVQGDVIRLHISDTVLNISWDFIDTIPVNVSCFGNFTTPLVMNFISTQTAITEGSTVEVRRFLPDQKASEFLLGAIRLGNLMISDPDIYGVVSVEPWSDFYKGTNVFTDISEEIDFSQDIEIRPSANEFAKRLIFTFKKGTETDAVAYENKWGTPYGDLVFDQSSFFAKGEQKWELPFGTIIPYLVAPNIIVPRFIDIDENNNVKPTKGVPRIMFRNGNKSGNWQLSRNGGWDNLSTYPSVHHFNNWQAPTIDLNFSLVSELKYVASAVTTNNSYKIYYETFIDEITNSQGKYVQLYRKVNNAQVRNIDWGKLLMWNGVLFRFNKVVDFDSEIRETTKIEMIKVLKASSSFSRTGVVIGVTPKLPDIFGKVIGGTVKDPGTGVPVISGGKSEALKYAKLIQG